MSPTIEIEIAILVIGYAAVKIVLAWHAINKRLAQIDDESEECSPE